MRLFWYYFISVSLVIHSLAGQNLVRVQDTVGVKDILDLLHDVDHLRSLAVVKVLGLLITNAVLSADTTFVFSDELHYEGID